MTSALNENRNLVVPLPQRTHAYEAMGRMRLMKG
jgi:hypothetical protein